jgi:GTP-binding protein
LVSDRAGVAVAYGLAGLADRGTFFVRPGEEVYEGMVVGESNRDDDLPVNVCRTKKLTNMRAAGRDENVQLAPPRVMSLEEALEYVEDDELLEVTPTALRMRKRVRNADQRRKLAKTR